MLILVRHADDCRSAMVDVMFFVASSWTADQRSQVREADARASPCSTEAVHRGTIPVGINTWSSVCCAEIGFFLQNMGHVQRRVGDE